MRREVENLKPNLFQGWHSVHCRMWLAALALCTHLEKDLACAVPPISQFSTPAFLGPIQSGKHRFPRAVTRHTHACRWREPFKTFGDFNRKQSASLLKLSLLHGCLGCVQELCAHTSAVQRTLIRMWLRKVFVASG